MTNRYDETQIAKYIDLYRKIQHCAVVLQSCLSVREGYPAEKRSLFDSPIREFVRDLNIAISNVKSDIPNKIRKKVVNGHTPEQLEDIAIKALAEIETR